MATVREMMIKFRLENSLHKSHKAKAPGNKRPVLDTRNKPKPKQNPKAGDYVRVHRPDIHKEPVLGRVLSLGKDGMKVTDSAGKAIPVRHEHVIEAFPAVNGKERAEFNAALGEQGVPLDVRDRYLRQNADGKAPRRPTAAMLAFADTLAQEHGVPLDMDRIRDGATHDELAELLEHYITDPAKGKR